MHSLCYSIIVESIHTYLLKVLKVGLVGITSGQQYLVRPPFRLGDSIFADSTP